MRELFVLGDSISIHYGPYLETMTAGLYRYDRLSDQESGEARNGGDSVAVRRYLEGADGRFDILLLNCGLHDLRRGPETGTYQVPADEYRRNLGILLDCAVELASAVVWARITPLNEAIHNRLSSAFHRFEEDVDRYNQIADTEVARRQVTSCDLCRFTRSLGEEIWCDHVHFVEEVRKLQAAYLAGFTAARFS